MKSLKDFLTRRFSGRRFSLKLFKFDLIFRTKDPSHWTSALEISSTFVCFFKLKITKVNFFFHERKKEKMGFF